MPTLFERLRTALADRYAIEREIGRGGMATVFLAQDLRHKRPVAVKVLAPDIGRTVGPERFVREIEIAAQLTHPHILPMFESGDADGLLFYVMPYVAGESLRHRLGRERQLAIADAVRIAREVADALDYAHRFGIVHRDIKPENVLLEEGHAIVADFGVARALARAGKASQLTEAGLAIGTAHYMSPEQSAGDPSIDGRTDLYALGCMLYEMLAGRPVFEGPSSESVARQHMVAKPERLRTLRPEVSQGLEQVVDRALAKHPAERWLSGAEFGAALASASGRAPEGILESLRLRGRSAAGVLAVAAALVGAFFLFRGHAEPVPEANLLAVAPFDVFVPDLALWREGLVDVLSHELDGAGPLRTVAPTVVVRRWSGRADAPSAAALGRRTGARLAVFGQVLGAGGDSVRVTATLFDVGASRSLGDFEVRDVSGRMDRIADSLTVALLRGLGRTRAIGAVRSASLGASSVPALKAYLQGEQFFRRTAWDSAMTYYRRAIALDTNFALAFRRMQLALGWERSGSDSLARVYALRAGALNHGLAPRESLLVMGDSLSAALFQFGDDTAFWAHARRVFATLGEATRRYPDDPEAWYALGDAQFHFGFAPRIGATRAQALASFDRSIALDSAFGPAYIHPIQLALELHGPTVAEGYIRAYLALDPTDINAEGIRVVARLIDPAEAGSAGVARVLDSVPPRFLQHAELSVMHWPDSAETAVRLLRVLARRAPGPTGFPLGSENDFLALELAYRGHLREAYRLAPTNPVVVAVAAALRTIPADSANAVFEPMLRSPSTALAAAVAWWASQGDTVHLRAVQVVVDSLARLPRLASSRGLLRYYAAALRAYRTLARRDTTQALAEFLALPDSLCPFCYIDRLTRVELLTARGRDREAAPLVDVPLVNPLDIDNGFLALEGGRIYERLGDKAQAIAAYQYVVDVWRHADAELDPFVREARAALRRLTGEPS